MKKTFIILSLAVLMNGCNKGNEYDLFKTTGDVETRIRERSGFTQIQLEDNMDVYLKQGPNFKVELEAGKNLHENIKSDVVGNILVLKDNNTLGIFRSHLIKIKFFITLPYLKNIDHFGVGTIYFQNQFTQDTMRALAKSSGDLHMDVNCNYFSTSAHGDGTFYLNGSAIKSYHYMNGINFLYMENFTVQNYRFIETLSIGHCHLKAQGDTLEANVWTDGNIYFKGNFGKISYQRHGKGDIVKE